MSLWAAACHRASNHLGWSPDETLEAILGEAHFDKCDRYIWDRVEIFSQEKETEFLCDSVTAAYLRDLSS